MDFFFKYLIFIFLNSVMMYSSYIITRYILISKSRIDFAVKLIGVFISIQSGYILFFGSVGLTGLNFHIILMAIALSALLIYHIKARNKWKPMFEKISVSYNRLQLFLLVFLLSSLGLVFVIILYNAVRYPPFDFDAIFFYLPSVVNWIKTGKITVWNQPLIVERYYPCGYYLFTYWIMIVFKSDFLIGFIQPVMLIFSAVNIIGICRKLGFKSFWSDLCAMSIVSMPIIFDFATKENNDMGVLYTFTLALYFLLCLRQYKKNTYLIISSISTGMLLGIKYTGVYWTLLIGFMALWILIESKTTFKKLFLNMFLWITGVILWGGYWYIRNFIITGNIVYPEKTKIFGIPLYLNKFTYEGTEFYSGIVKSSTMIKNINYLWDKAIDWYFPILGIIYFLAGLSLIMIAFRLITLIFSKPLLHLIKDIKFIYFVITLVAVMFFLITPAGARTNANIRYGIPAIVMLILGLGFFTKNNILKIIIEALLVSNIVLSIIWYTKYSCFIFPLAIITSLTFILILMKKHNFIFIRFGLKKIINPKSALVSLLIIFMAMPFILQLMNKFVSNHRFYEDTGYTVIDKYLNDGWKWLDQNIDGRIVASVESRYIYPLFNSRFTNDLVFINAVNEEELIKTAVLKNVDYMFFQSVRKFDNTKMSSSFTYEMPIEQTWIAKHPDIFSNVFTNKGVMIYKNILKK